MILGLDFDNTIARYDALFHHLAVERGLIPDSLPATKTAVRDHLRRANREDDWTELQGLAYGPRIVEAEPFPGCLTVLEQLAAGPDTLHIVSHKTRTPYRGEPHDLHAAARAFLKHHGISPRLIPADRVHLCLTKADKLRQIATLRCDAFVDDLPELLGEADFPAGCRRILFDPANVGRTAEIDARIDRWSAIPATLRKGQEQRHA
jgi:hypothetical protein